MTKIAEDIYQCEDLSDDTVLAGTYKAMYVQSTRADKLSKQAGVAAVKGATLIEPAGRGVAFTLLPSEGHDHGIVIGSRNNEQLEQMLMAPRRVR